MAVKGVDKDGVLAIFYHSPVQDVEASEIEGRPVFKNEAMVEIRVPGQHNSVMVTPVRERDMERWPDAWAAFERGDEFEGGTPVEQWPFCTQLKCAELKASGFTSVEQVAAVSDTHLKKLGLQGRELRDRAQQFLAGADETEKKLRKRIKELEAQVAGLESKLRNKVDDDTPSVKPANKRRGRNSAAIDASGIH